MHFGETGRTYSLRPDQAIEDLERGPAPSFRRRVLRAVPYRPRVWDYPSPTFPLVEAL